MGHLPWIISHKAAVNLGHITKDAGSWNCAISTCEFILSLLQPAYIQRMIDSSSSLPSYSNSYRFLSSHNGAIGKDKQNKNRSDQAGNALSLTRNHRLIHVKMGSCFARADLEHWNNHCPYVFSLTIYLSLIKVKQQRKCFSVGSRGTEMTALAVSFKAASWA